MKQVHQDLDLAKQMLSDPDQYEKDITEVALDSGFYEIKKFNVEFRRATNMCPTEYRAFHIKFIEVTGMTPEEYRQNQKETVDL